MKIYSSPGTGSGRREIVLFIISRQLDEKVGLCHKLFASICKIVHTSRHLTRVPRRFSIVIIVSASKQVFQNSRTLRLARVCWRRQMSCRCYFWLGRRMSEQRKYTCKWIDGWSCHHRWITPAKVDNCPTKTLSDILWKNLEKRR